MVMRYYIAKINKLLLQVQPPLFERSIIQTKYFYYIFYRFLYTTYSSVYSIE